MENSSARTREYLALRISQLEHDIKEIPVENDMELAVEFGRLEEARAALRVLNGAPVPEILNIHQFLKGAEA